jgi:hypothetical protein
MKARKTISKESEMLKKIDTVLFIEREKPVACEECGAVAELLPYGPGSKNICLDCGNKNSLAALAAMAECVFTHSVIAKKMLVGVTAVVGPDGEVFKIGCLEEDLLEQSKGN